MSEFLGRKRKSPIVITVVASSSFSLGYPHATVHFSGEILWREHRGKNSHKIRSSKVLRLLLDLLLPSSETKA